jgi:hypothetical protein
VQQRLQEFNAAGQAYRIKRVATLAEMAARYKSGELDPKFVMLRSGRGLSMARGYGASLVVDRPARPV